MSLICTAIVSPEGVNVPHGGAPPYITPSTSATPSSASAASRGVTGAPAVSSASMRWISASCACRRYDVPTRLSPDQCQAGSSGSARRHSVTRAWEKSSNASRISA